MGDCGQTNGTNTEAVTGSGATINNSTKPKVRRSQKIKNKLKEFKLLYNNIRGIKSKKESLKEIIAEERPTVVALVETLLEENEKLIMEGYTIIERTNFDTNNRGIVIAVKNELLNITKEGGSYNEVGEQAWVDIDNRKVKLSIGVVYAPQESKTSKQELGNFYKEIQRRIKMAKEQGRKIIIAGDMNAKVGEEIENNKPKVTKGGKLLMRLVETDGIVMLNGQGKCQGTWTRIERESKSVIDYVLVDEDSEHNVKKMLIDEEKLGTPYRLDKTQRIYTDHCTITVTFNWFLKERNTEDKIAVTKQNLKIFNKKTSGQELQQIWIEEHTPTARKYERWSKRVAEIAKETMTMKKRKPKESKKISVFRRKKKLVKQLIKREKTVEMKNLFIKRLAILNDQIIIQMKKEQQERTVQIAQRIKTEKGMNRNNFWEYMRKVKGRNPAVMHDVLNKRDELETSPEGIRDAYKEYYKDLLKKEPMTTKEGREKEILMERMINVIEEKSKNKMVQVKNKEIESAVKKLKKRKAGDREGWKNEMIAGGGTDMKRSFELMIKTMLKEKIVPEEWARIRIQSVLKKGPKKDLANQRGLFITNIVSKVVERVLIDRNKEKMMKNISPFQSGGRKNRSVSDNLFILNSTIQHFKRKKENLYILFTDLRKCFDKLWLEDSIMEMICSGMAVEDAEYLYRMNKEAKAIVTTPAGNTEEFELEKIVKQGTVAGPTMAGVSIDKINRVESANYLQYYEVQIKYPAFVDDVIGMGEVEVLKDMNAHMQMLESMKKFEYDNKMGKTNYMIIKNKKEVEDIELVVQKAKIEEIHQCKYLGDVYDSKPVMK